MEKRAPPLPPDLHRRLEDEFGILHLLYHRNHNQHRVAVWWSSLEMLHLHTRKLLLLLDAYAAAPKYKTKARLHQQALGVARFLVRRVCVKCLYTFNTIIALGHFVPLGMTLVAAVSAIRALATEIDGPQDSRANPLIENHQTKQDSADDIGEEIVEVKADVAAAPEIPEQVVLAPEKTAVKPKTRRPAPDEEQRTKKKKKKAKKSKNAIDDIFG